MDLLSQVLGLPIGFIFAFLVTQMILNVWDQRLLSEMSDKLQKRTIDGHQTVSAKANHRRSRPAH